MTTTDLNRELAGRVAIVTGAGSGIGRASADLLARRGASVVIVDRSAEGGVLTASAIAEGGGQAISVVADAGAEEDMERVVIETMSTFGRLDILFANAAIHHFGTALTTTPQAWDEVLRVNLRGPFLAIRATLPHMVASGRGVIVATSSDCAVRTCAQSVAYVASKAGLIGLIRSVAVDFGPRGVRANVVVPGVTDTPGLRAAYSSEGHDQDEGMARAAALSPLRRVGTPADLAETVAYLCSDRAAFVTGATILVDGGMTVTYGAD